MNQPNSANNISHVGFIIKIFSVIALTAILLACKPSENQLERIHHQGKLKVILPPAVLPITLTPTPLSLEQQLAQSLASKLNVDVEFMPSDTASDSLKQLTHHEANIAMGLTITHIREQLVNFSLPYQTVEEYVVYNRDNKPLQSLQALVGTDIHVLSGSSHNERLQALQIQHPGLQWQQSDDYTTEQLLAEVNSGSLEATLINSHRLVHLQHHYPEINIGFDTTHNNQLALALPKVKRFPYLHAILVKLSHYKIPLAGRLAHALPIDTTLLDFINQHIKAIDKNGDLDRWIAQQIDHVQPFDYVDNRTYLLRIQTILPQYLNLFQEAAGDDLDWRLLAAISYQESHWDPLARSPTGVRGMMQLTLPTAGQLGVTNRLDPKQSILGGSTYVKQLISRLPETIVSVDRIWFALAAYNIGWGHLMDARDITALQGGNPNQWVSVKARLPLLTDPAWYEQTHYGYARGHETVAYVDNIRRYYEVLVMQTEET